MVAPELEQLDARPGSGVSLLRTLLGLHREELAAGVSSAALLRVLGALGVPAAAARSAISRTKRQGVLEPLEVAGRPGYRLSPATRIMHERGDQRIFHAPRAGADDPWLLLSAPLPEAQRDLRHQLRRRLTEIGCGTVADGMRIAPAVRRDDLERIIDQLGVRAAATVFTVQEVRAPEGLRAALRHWWDLDAIAEEHRGFLEARAAADPTRAALASWVELIDSYRPLPYRDPGLPLELLPDPWPAEDTRRLIAASRLRWAEASRHELLALLD